METKKTYLIFIFLVGTTSIVFAQAEKMSFSSLDSLKFTRSINLHLNKNFQSPLSKSNFTSAFFKENRWTNAYNPSNTSLVKDKTTGYWINMTPSYFPINDFKSSFITGLILGLLSK